MPVDYPFVPTPDTVTIKYSRYDRFREIVAQLADLLADPSVEPTTTDQFKNIEEKFWLAVVNMATINATTGFIHRADTLAAMRALESNINNRVCILTGNDSAYDGGGGLYAWEVDPASLAVDNPVIDVIPTDRATVSSEHRGYWKKVS